MLASERRAREVALVPAAIPPPIPLVPPTRKAMVVVADDRKNAVLATIKNAIVLAATLL